MWPVSKVVMRLPAKQVFWCSIHQRAFKINNLRGYWHHQSRPYLTVPSVLTASRISDPLTLSTDRAFAFVAGVHPN
jgi:hypothetical protein